MVHDEDLVLVQEMRKGNEHAFRDLVEKYKKMAYYTAFQFVKNHDDAEDVSQEAFIRVFKEINRFRGDAAFRSWFYRIVVNLSLNAVKRNKSKRTDSMEQPQDIMIHKPDENSDVGKHVEKALDKLSEKQRTIFILRHYQGFSTTEVSGMMNISEGSVKTHLFRAIRNLQTSLDFLLNEWER